VSVEPELTILLVEDELLNRTLVQAILARATDHRLRAARLREAETLAAARTILAELPVDIVLLDVQLPDGNGLELAAELIKLPAGQRPIIIALTAGALAEQHEAAIAAGCDAVLIKPYTVEAFETVMAAHVADLN
jgi:two-component system, OmpR family, KDP operon response regulator KdpE